MHNRGWRSIHCITKRDAFRGSAPIDLTDRLHQLGAAMGDGISRNFLLKKQRVACFQASQNT
ncbi:hypothetical protein DITRI_Ditri08aG0081500 [Diplodiscus trichospermus]